MAWRVGIGWACVAAALVLSRIRSPFGGGDKIKTPVLPRDRRFCLGRRRLMVVVGKAEKPQHHCAGAALLSANFINGNGELASGSDPVGAIPAEISESLACDGQTDARVSLQLGNNFFHQQGHWSFPSYG
jgi:hypothetical protein